MDPTKEADQTLAEDYWLNTAEGSIVEGKPVFDADWFKWEKLFFVKIYYQRFRWTIFYLF